MRSAGTTENGEASTGMPWTLPRRRARVRNSSAVAKRSRQYRTWTGSKCVPIATAPTSGLPMWAVRSNVPRPELRAAVKCSSPSTATMCALSASGGNCDQRKKSIQW